MSFLFVHPPITRVQSGGNIYNAHILAQARNRDFQLTSIPISPGRTEDLSKITLKSPVIIWDSLFIPYLSKFQKPPDTREILLLHFLPSEDPSLSALEHERLYEKEQKAIERSDGLIVTGRKLLNRLRARWPEKTVFLCEPGTSGIFYQTNLNLYRFETRAHFNLLTVANITAAKGHIDLARVLSTLRNTNWHWHIVGYRGSDRNCFITLRNTIRRLKIESQITFHGVLTPNRLARFMKRIDIYISASRFESYGMAIAEAVAAGIPIVSTRVGDAERLVIHNQNGFLVETGKRRFFREILSILMTNPIRYRNLKKRCGSKPQRWEDTFLRFRDACHRVFECRSF